MKKRMVSLARTERASTSAVCQALMFDESESQTTVDRKEKKR